MHPFLDWCHGHLEQITKLLHIGIEYHIRLNQPIYDDMVPSNVFAQPYIVNYRNRRHIYLFNPSSSTVTLSDNAGEWITVLSPNNWTLMSAPSGTQLKANLNPCVIRAICTDEIFAPNINNARSVSTVFTNNGTSVTFTSPDIAVSQFSELAADIVFTSFTGGAAPTITYTIKRKDAFGNYLTIYQSAALSTATNIAISLGSGMGSGTLPASDTGEGVSFSDIIQVSYTTTGAPTSVTQSISVKGK